MSLRNILFAPPDLCSMKDSGSAACVAARRAFTNHHISTKITGNRFGDGRAYLVPVLYCVLWKAALVVIAVCVLFFPGWW